MRFVGSQVYADGVKPVSAIISLAIFVASQATIAKELPTVPEENYDFLLVSSGPCVPAIGTKVGTKKRAECERMSQPGRYRGTWFVAFETSLFTPVGKQSCIATKGRTLCAELKGVGLPWPPEGACPRLFQIEFVGRRNVLPGFDPSYRIVVDDVIGVKRLPDPPHEPGDCDPAIL